jgi:hypothetical protein
VSGNATVFPVEMRSTMLLPECKAAVTFIRIKPDMWGAITIRSALNALSHACGWHAVIDRIGEGGMKIRRALSFGLVGAAVSLAACSPVMESNRPDPIDLKQFTVGEDRIKVITTLGAPMSTVENAGNSCDVYQLYTHGPGASGKVAIAAGEAVADVFTLGLAEVVFTPVEAGTKNAKHTVTFCYGADTKLVSVQESETKVN